MIYKLVSRKQEGGRRGGGEGEEGDGGRCRERCT